MPDAAIEALREAQEMRRVMKTAPEPYIPTGKRVPHPAEAGAEARDLTIAEMRWQRVLEVIYHREPWVEMYLRGSRIESADSRTVNYTVRGENAVSVLNRTPAMDVVHQAIFDVTRKRLHPVAHLGSAQITDEEREMYARAMDDAQRAIRREFPAAEVEE